MIKKTLYFGNPAYLSLQNKQLIIKLPEVEKSELPDVLKEEGRHRVPIEDIGVVMVDHPQITLTSALFTALMEVNATLIFCDAAHLPSGQLTAMVGHSEQTDHLRYQVAASQPLLKQLWQQTVRAKIRNQAALLTQVTGEEEPRMEYLLRNVSSGDANNNEAQAAAYYWPRLFVRYPGFRRERDGEYPNALLNYGYAILRASIARALVGAGLLPALGIFHRNKYNPYCLADDIMEPYRPFVDAIVVKLLEQCKEPLELSKEVKGKFLMIPALDVSMKKRLRPLSLAASETTASLRKCYMGTLRNLVYPEFPT